MVTSSAIEAIVSVKHLSEFLNAKELQQGAMQQIDKSSRSMGDEVQSIKDGGVRMDEEQCPVSA